MIHVLKEACPHGDRSFDYTALVAAVNPKGCAFLDQQV